MIWIKILGLCMVLNNALTIDVDYFISNPTRVRRNEIKCDPIRKIKCQTRCGRNSLCLNNKCYCVSVRLVLEPGDLLGTSTEETDDYNMYSIDEEVDKTEIPSKKIMGLDLMNEDADETEPLPVSLLTKHQLLRHHIAHFCPNLEIARQCIRKCMQVGKPAFCGKDHVCYCGHKYSDHDVNKKIDVEKTNAMFADLYTKYFGPNTDSSESEESKEDKDRKKKNKKE